MTREIVLAGDMRAPFGDFGKSLKDIPLAALGIHAIAATSTATASPSATRLAPPARE